MYRVRLASVIAISFIFVAILAATLYWGAEQVARNVQRSESAYDTFIDYARVSQQAYRHFKQRMDYLLIERSDDRRQIDLSSQRLQQAINALRNRITGTFDSPKEAVPASREPGELELVAKLTAFLEASEYRFDEVERLKRKGNNALAFRTLSTFSEGEIDTQFQPLIDDAVARELQKAHRASDKMEQMVARSRTLAMLAIISAALFGVGAGMKLVSGLKKPIEALMAGTDAIASGNLRYRIALKGKDEFAYLARHFNLMAQKLELQQEKLRESRVLLEYKVEERTAELQQLNIELQRMDQARRAFLADISHELRTPITVIRGEAEVTLRGGDRDIAEYKDTLQRIVELSMQLGKYVNDLLFLARNESANLQFEWEEIDISELVASAIEDLQVMALERELTVRCDAITEGLIAKGDPQRLRQVLFILGENACRYSRTGGDIRISLIAEDNHAIFRIADQGIGIPEDDLPRIFERHYRSPNAMTTCPDGSGLGLAMARAILTAHGGAIRAESRENQGTVFTVELPIIQNVDRTTI